jgi:hypothetical protein
MFLLSLHGNDPSVVSPSDIDQSPTTSIMPEHVFRMKGFFELPKNFSYNLEFLYATTFNSQSNYEYDLQRYPNIISQGGIIVGRNNSRTIVNMSVHKIILDDKLKISLFGNDIFNSGIIANSTAYGNVTLSQIRAMYGASIAYKF